MLGGPPRADLATKKMPRSAAPSTTERGETKSNRLTPRSLCHVPSKIRSTGGMRKLL